MVNKIALAYSGGLDTSVMIPWLKEHYHAEVVAVICDLGQDENLCEIREKAINSGACKALVLDVKQEFVLSYLWPLLKSGATYEDHYLLGTISRPLIAKKLVEIAHAEKINSVAHGATGKGNDQVRFEYTIKALSPDLKIIAPWREWDIKSRTEAMNYAALHGISIPTTPKAPFSRDRNIWYVSHEGGVLEDPSQGYPNDMLLMVNSIENTPNLPEIITIGFESGQPCKVNDVTMAPLELLDFLNKKAGLHGIGVTDMIENRLVGMKSRGVYEVPGGSVLHIAHQKLETLCLDKATAEIKRFFKTAYGNLVYDGKWFSPLKKALDAFINETQQYVTGKVKLKLFKGQVTVCGVESPFSLYQPEMATFEADTVYCQKDAEGFINLYALSAKIYSSIHGGLYD
ncbi:MAG: argininosuccinate synthase [Gammaproteobacteria bacterium]